MSKQYLLSLLAAYVVAEHPAAIPPLSGAAPVHVELLIALATIESWVREAELRDRIERAQRGARALLARPARGDA